MKKLTGTRERRRLPHPSGVVGDPVEWDATFLAHLRQQAHDGPVVFRFQLSNRAANGESVEDLPHRLRVVLRQYVLDMPANALDHGLGTAGALYLFLFST